MSPCHVLSVFRPRVHCPDKEQCLHVMFFPFSDPEYKSKLFLDCCGLVRRVMLNLKSDFGFVIGPWNQAYMYDTLPITVKHEDNMKPGDLVFISATYYASKSKR